MIDASNAEYKAWVERLVHTCLPLELERKIAYGQPLTREEAEKYANVVNLVSEYRRLGNHAETMARLEKLQDEVKRQGQLTRQEFRKSQRDPLSVKDKRPKAQRTLIDKAVHLYVLLHDINGSSDTSFLSCCNRYWDLATEHFTDITQYKNFVNYDYNNFYDISALEDMIRRGDITI